MEGMTAKVRVRGALVALIAEILADKEAEITKEGKVETAKKYILDKYDQTIKKFPESFHDMAAKYRDKLLLEVEKNPGPTLLSVRGQAFADNMLTHATDVLDVVRQLLRALDAYRTYTTGDMDKPFDWGGKVHVKPGDEPLVTELATVFKIPLTQFTISTEPKPKSLDLPPELKAILGAMFNAE